MKFHSIPLAIIFILVILIASGATFTETAQTASLLENAYAPATPSAPNWACGGYFNAIADASIGNTAPDTPYGDGLNLPIFKFNDGDTVYQRITLLEFNLLNDVPADARIIKAELELPIHESGVPNPHHFEVYDLENGFDELAVTWNTQPLTLTSYADIHTNFDDGVLRVDITPLVIHWLQKPVSQTLALIPADVMDLSFSSRESGNGPRLFIDCVYPVEPILPDLSARDQAQQAALERLQAESTTTPVVQLGPAGSLRFADFTLPIQGNGKPDNLARAQWFLEEYKDLLRLDDPTTELQFIRRSDDGHHLFFRQRVHGIPVFPSNLVVHIEPGMVTGLSGGYIPDLVQSATPLLPLETAEQIAAATAGENAKILGQSQLRYLNMGLVGFQDDDNTYLAWQINAVGAENPAIRFIDAHNGQILLELPHSIINLFDMALYTGNNDGDHTIWPCWDNPFIWTDDQWFDETGLYARWPDPTPPTPDAEGIAANNNIKAVYNYWVTQLGRSSYDGRGQEIRMYVHVGKDWKNANAVWLCDIMQFGDQMTTKDLVGHEFTHHVVGKTAGLVYAFQSGALNESYADIFGYFVDNDDWTIGEGSAVGAARDMRDPNKSAYWQPDKMSDYTNKGIDDDWGGVHYDSGIQNKAAYLLIQGDTFNSWTVTGIGQSKAQHLFYNVLSKRLGMFSNLTDARNDTVAEAKALVRSGAYGFTANDLCQVRNAFAAVELGAGDRDCDGIEDYADLDDDNDGVEDAVDNCRSVPNGGQSNVDKDDKGDACDNDIDNDGIQNDNNQDNCPFIKNFSQDDSDSDGIGDACDDSDQDGISDIADNCINTPNTDQQDQDKDNIGDACDADLDNDGVNNSTDNCANLKNTDQGNQDGDDFGDVCDLCPKTQSNDNTDTDRDGLANPCDPDDDDDGVLDDSDNCPQTFNPQQHDLDEDGKGSACDWDDQLLLANGNPFYDDAFEFPTANWPWQMVLPVCNDCVHDYLPENFAKTLQIELPIGFQARVVDSEGMPLASKTTIDGQLELTFYPAPHATTPPYPLGILNANGFNLEPDQMEYMLQIFPAEGTDLTSTYPFWMKLTTTSDYIYLPMVMR